MKLETFFFRKGTTNFIFKFGSTRKFDSRVTCSEEGVLNMEYFVRIADSDKRVEIKQIFKRIALEYFKPLKYILIVEDGYKVSRENNWIYEINFYAKVDRFEEDKEKLINFRDRVEEEMSSMEKS